MPFSWEFAGIWWDFNVIVLVILVGFHGFLVGFTWMLMILVGFDGDLEVFWWDLSMNQREFCRFYGIWVCLKRGYKHRWTSEIGGTPFEAHLYIPDNQEVDQWLVKYINDWFAPIVGKFLTAFVVEIGDFISLVSFPPKHISGFGSNPDVVDKSPIVSHVLVYCKSLSSLSLIYIRILSYLLWLF